MNTRHLKTGDLADRRWRGLVRESTAEQARKESTPERQRADLRRAAAELGMVGVEPLFYERVGSGEDEGVPELAQALADGRAGQYDVLVVFHTSRFARNRAEAVTMKREFKKAGIVIYFVAQRIISGTFTSALSEGISEVLDEHENEQRRLWIAGGIRERQRSGRWAGGIPFGYRRVLVDFPDGSRGWDGALEPDPAQSPVVRRVFERFAAGGTGRAVALGLNVTGHRAPTGLPWTAGSIHRLLSNPAYAGRLVRYRRRTEGHYYDRTDPEDGFADLGPRFPAIVDEGLFAAAQEQLRRQRWTSGPRRRHYPLSGVLRCRGCGYAMTGASNGHSRYYRCRGRAEFGSCDAGFVRADDIERRFATWLASYTLPDDWRAEIARTRVKAARTDEQDRQRRLGERLERIRKMYAWGDLDEAAYRRESAEIRSQMGVVALPATGSLEDVALALSTLGPAWLAAPSEVQTALPPLMLHAGEVGEGSVEWVVRAELKPLLDLCVVGGTGHYSASIGYTVRFSA